MHLIHVCLWCTFSARGLGDANDSFSWVAAAFANFVCDCDRTWLHMSAAPWWEILTVLAHTLHLTLEGFPGTAEMNGHVFVHSLLNFVLYLKAPEYLDFAVLSQSVTLRNFGELSLKSSSSERLVPLSEDVSNSAIRQINSQSVIFTFRFVAIEHC